MKMRQASTTLPVLSLDTITACVLNAGRHLNLKECTMSRTRHKEKAKKKKLGNDELNKAAKLHKHRKQELKAEG